MKKFMFLMCFLLCSCQSIPDDTYTYEPPTLRRNVYRYIFDENHKLFSKYKDKSYVRPLNRNILAELNDEVAIRDNSWHGRLSPFLSYNEITSYIFKNSGNKIGTVSLSGKIKRLDCFDNILWNTPTILTFTIINLLGYPIERDSFDIYVNAEVFNNEGEIVKTYSSQVHKSYFAGYYYNGYNSNEDIFYPDENSGVIESQAYKEALNDILLQIDNDDELYNQLNAPYKKAFEEKQKEEAIKKENEIRERKQKEQESMQKLKDRKHLDNVLNEMKSL